MNRQSSAIDRVRELMGPGNPVPSGTAIGSWDDEPGQHAYQRIVAMTGTGDGPAAVSTDGRRSRTPAGTPPPGGRAWRLLAPVGAGLAVIGLAVGLTMTAGSHPARPGPAAKTGEGGSVPAGLPPFYVTLSQNSTLAVIASVHSAQTGQVLSQVEVGAAGSGGVRVSAEPSGRAFVIYSGLRQPPGEGATFLLRVSHDGRTATLQRLGLVLGPRGSDDRVSGIAVSPDGTRLAVLLQSGTGTLNTYTEIRVLPLAGGAAQTWTATGDPGEAWSPVWTGPGQLTFVWQYHLHGNENFYLGSSEVRVLNTSAPGHNFLLGSRVIAAEAGRLSIIQSAGAGPAGTPLAVAVVSVTSMGGSGTETLQLDQLSATGSVSKVLTSTVSSYSGAAQEGRIAAGCQILGVAPDGAMLAECPHFGRIVDGTFTPLADSSGVFAAAW